jgi:hypothetical protein
VSIQIRVTIPLDTLRGTSNEPGELAGYAPIPAEQARETATDPQSVWQRLVTDPVSGALPADHGTTRYRPPHLAEHVIARHQHCQHPGCRAPAHLCDLDHNQPYNPAADQGPTSAANLGPKMPTAPPAQGLLRRTPSRLGAPMERGHRSERIDIVHGPVETSGRHGPIGRTTLNRTAGRHHIRPAGRRRSRRLAMPGDSRANPLGQGDSDSTAGRAIDTSAADAGDQESNDHRKQPT